MGIKSITTKRGDAGKSRLFSGEEVSKNSARLDTYGDIDELVAILGLARFHAQKKEVKESLLFIQNAFFPIASELATTKAKLQRLPRRVDEHFLAELEERRERLEPMIKIPDGFVVSGDCLSAAHIDHARTVCRRVERKIVSLFETGDIENKVLLVWLNRLSDYLYLLARHEEEHPRMVS